ncbi:MAG: maleylacetoacetate isomerase [Caulobacteraceae bacterium]|nr:maleylacetoacetate isomerase [Caulobacteraceae bacterium]
MELVLHSSWRATAPYRVRIGLNLKGLAYEYRPVNLLAGEQRGEAYRAINPQGLAPALIVDGRVMTQSLAILEWLEETCPEPAFLPRDPADRAAVRAMADIVACDIHPLNNTRVGRALGALGVSDADQLGWIRRWITDGFCALEPMIARHGGGYCFGDAPGLADCCLVPQVYSARRFGVDFGPFPAIAAAAERAGAHPAFAAAHPDRQPDALKS